MADTIHRYSRPVRDAEGRMYVAEAHGRRATTGMWEGWIEFIGVGRAIVLRSGIETRQADRRALAYWASGLQPTYLDGALRRALRLRLQAFREAAA